MKLVRPFIVGCVLAATACSGNGGESSRFTRSTLAVEGELMCDPVPMEGTTIVHECLNPETGDTYKCKILPPEIEVIDKSMRTYCVRIAKAPRPSPCDNPSFPGDGKSGLQCWNPPKDYCKNGVVPSNDWYCKPDGSKCCKGTSSTCFLCGWWLVGRQGTSVYCWNPEEPSSQIPDEQCDQFAADLKLNSPAMYECLGVYDDGPECDEFETDSECAIAISPDDPICP
jgi:hypothetical protein